MKSTRKIFTLLLMLAMVFTYMPVYAFEEGVFENQEPITTEEAAETTEASFEEAEAAVTDVASEETEAANADVVSEETEAVDVVEEETNVDTDSQTEDPFSEEDSKSLEDAEAIETQGMEAQEESVSKLNLTKSSTITLKPDEDKVLATFKYDGTSIVYAYAESAADGAINCVELYIRNKNNKNTHCSSRQLEGWSGFIFADFGSSEMDKFWQGNAYALTMGDTYEVCIKNTESISHKFKYNLKTYESFAQTVNLPSEVTIDVITEYGVITASEMNSGSKMPLIVDWSTSNDDIAYALCDECGTAWLWVYKAGSCTLTATLINGKKYTCKVNVTDKTIRLKETFMEMRVGQSFTQKLLNKGKGKIKWSSTNKKVATISSKGVVKAKGPGKCKVKAKYKGKTYVCNIEVYRELPDYDAYIDDYNTRNMWFIVPITNYADLPLTVYSAGAKAIDADSKAWDRKLKLKKGKSLTIKPGKTVNVYFKVSGKKTAWPDVDDYTIYYTIGYNGAKYKALVTSDEEDSSFKLTKKGYYYVDDEIEYYDPDWYYTYN